MWSVFFKKVITTVWMLSLHQTECIHVYICVCFMLFKLTCAYFITHFLNIKGEIQTCGIDNRFPLKWKPYELV